MIADVSWDKAVSTIPVILLNSLSFQCCHETWEVTHKSCWLYSSCAGMLRGIWYQWKVFFFFFFFFFFFSSFLNDRLCVHYVVRV